jgi:hypothetical protein
MESNATRASLQLRNLEGRRVNLSLTNGSQLKGVEVVSAGRGGLSSLWIEIDGTDLIIDKAEILDILDVPVERAA